MELPGDGTGGGQGGRGRGPAEAGGERVWERRHLLHSTGDSRCPRNKTCSSALGTGVSLDSGFGAGFQSLKWCLSQSRAGPPHPPLLAAGQAGFSLWPEGRVTQILWTTGTGGQRSLAYFGPGLSCGPSWLVQRGVPGPVPAPPIPWPCAIPASLFFDKYPFICLGSEMVCVSGLSPV